ncbi:hypothetical protein CHU95_03115 [Niveispirillum lacus]|uniref:Uncharacterized protein n=1 Tax=Niveispirillum lacus TaxID=1981099 RepID=A0A255Z8N9_9PROT|nr:hypothetical protein [Niveispirillum lacus]OYQ36990.1 hypothetical protein CHU95_03115 [Niveispirillum lacus]
MGGITTPALMVLSHSAPGSSYIKAATGLVNTTRQAKDLLGITKSRRKKQERRLLEAEQAADSADLTARQAADLDDLQRRNASSAARIQAESERVQVRSRRALRQETGSLRAALGAQGISTADGSGEAVILGRERAAAEEQENAIRLDALKLAALSDDEEALKRRNLLDLTRQQERQRLERLARGL